jgi:hypothetical protein
VVLVAVQSQLGVVGVHRLRADGTLVGVVHTGSKSFEAILHAGSSFTQGCKRTNILVIFACVPEETVSQSDRQIDRQTDTAHTHAFTLLTFVAAGCRAGHGGDVDGGGGAGIGSCHLLELVSSSVAAADIEALKIMSFAQQKIPRFGEIGESDLAFAIFTLGTTLVVQLRIQIQMSIVRVNGFLA